MVSPTVQEMQTQTTQRTAPPGEVSETQSQALQIVGIVQKRYKERDSEYDPAVRKGSR